MDSKSDTFIPPIEDILNELKRQEEESDDNVSEYDPEETCSESEDVLLLNQDDRLDAIEDEYIDEDVKFSIKKEGIKSENREFELGKDLETVWTDKPLPSEIQNHTQKHLRNYVIGPQGEAKGLLNEKALFDLLITDEMIEPIVIYTNKEMEKVSKSLGGKQYYASPTDGIEIKALIGLLYLSAIFKKAGLNNTDMFSQIYGPPIFRSTMTKKRVEILLGAIHFDDKKTREARKVDDKFAAFRETWNKFQQNCSKCYAPSENLTVDKTLLSFRGKCPFKTYLPVKREKCGLRLISICDAMSFYFLGGIPYVGKKERRGALAQPAEFVLELAQPFAGSNRNITCDSWFSSFELVDELLKNNLTMVGTLKKNAPQIPPSMLLENSTRFLYHPGKMIASYTPQSNKHELLISSKHFTSEINREASKPQIVEYYDSTRRGVDVLNRLCRDKTTKRKSRRWTMRYFFEILDIAAVNSFILYKWNSSNYDYSNKARTNFIKNLSFGLTEPLMKRRSINSHLPRELRATVVEVLGCSVDDGKIPTASRKRRRCDFCESSKDRKGNQWCSNCNRILCGEHKVIFCPTCAREKVQSEE